MKKIISVVGARPQFIKLSPLHRALSSEQVSHVVVHTGQHYDDNMSDQFFRELDIPAPAYNLQIHGGTNTDQVSLMMPALAHVFGMEKPDIIIVYGDTNSTLAAAIVAKQHQIKLVHIEAGLRSFDITMPEELNRILTDRISDIHSCPTDLAYKQLVSEGLGAHATVDGDIMLDAVQQALSLVKENRACIDRYTLTKPYILCTIHRNFNTDSIERLRAITQALLCSEHRIIFPVHPRTKAALQAGGLWELFKQSSIECIDPVGYIDMLTLLNQACSVITDSGGLQKEAYILQKPCLTLREHTEWSETLTHGWNILAFTDQNADTTLLEQTIAAWPTPGPYVNYYGDGNACQNIIKRLEI